MSGPQEQIPQQERPQCAFCGYTVPRSCDPLDDGERSFCSEPCRDAYGGDEGPFTDSLGFKRRSMNVAALQQALPGGIRGNAAILLAGDEGTRRDAMLLEIVWRALEDGDPAVVATVDKPASVLIDSFLAHGWNVFPHLADGTLRILDLFTQRLEDEAAFTKRNNAWNSYVQAGFGDAFVEIREPSDVREVGNQVDNVLEDLDMTEVGLFAIDSMTEMASFTQDVQVVNFLKEMRAVVSKARYVPMFVGASVSPDSDLYPTDFPHDHQYIFDGIVDLQLDDDLVADDRVKRLSVRKMADTDVDSRWIAYEFRRDRGFVPVDPFQGE